MAKRPGRKAAAEAPVEETIARLDHLYSDATCSLDFRSPLELLVATILSAQCTDARVNQVTPEVFRRFPDAAALASAPPGELEDVIRSTGFFNAKAKSLRGMAKALVKENGGEVPRTMAALHALPGVGRKTANVVLGNVWGTPDGVVVDTHVGRIARRLGWTRQMDAVKVEHELNRIIPKDRWTWISHALIQHGRRICIAQRPKCDICTLADICPKVGVAAKEKETLAEKEKRKKEKKREISLKVKKRKEQKSTGAAERIQPATAIHASSKKSSSLPSPSSSSPSKKK
jgi:endonuclease III